MDKGGGGAADAGMIFSTDVSEYECIFIGTLTLLPGNVYNMR